jgi:hypothetical protein
VDEKVTTYIFPNLHNDAPVPAVLESYASALKDLTIHLSQLATDLFKDFDPAPLWHFWEAVEVFRQDRRPKAVARTAATLMEARRILFWIGVKLDDVKRRPCSDSIKTVPRWDKTAMTLSYGDKHTTLRPDAESVSLVFDWFEKACWKDVKIQGFDIVEDAGQVSNLVSRAKKTARRVGFVVSREGDVLKWSNKSDK